MKVIIVFLISLTIVSCKNKYGDSFIMTPKSYDLYQESKVIRESIKKGTARVATCTFNNGSFNSIKSVIKQPKEKKYSKVELSNDRHLCLSKFNSNFIGFYIHSKSRKKSCSFSKLNIEELTTFDYSPEYLTPFSLKEGKKEVLTFISQNVPNKFDNTKSTSKDYWKRKCELAYSKLDTKHKTTEKILGTQTNSESFVWPVDSKTINSHYGMRTPPKNPTAKKKMHHGIDIDGETGDPIYAAKSGFVVTSKYDPKGEKGRGEYIILLHFDGDMTHYGHIDHGKRKVSEGEIVSAGQIIGEMGSTGHSTGPHLHFEIHRNGKRIDPMDEY